jgi:pilus assembly protein Flp/PilA
VGVKPCRNQGRTKVAAPLTATIANEADMRSWILARFWRFGGATVEFGDDERGVTMLEYSLIGALIAAVCVSAVTNLGGGISSLFTNVAASIAGHH